MALADLSSPKGRSSPDAEQTDESILTKDEIFEVLKNRRRRETLRYLMDADGMVTLSELAEQIAAWENDIDIATLNSAQRTRVYVALYQTHLPKMDGIGVIDYDQNRGNIELGETADVLKLYLDADFGTDDTWHRRYIALSVTGGVLALVAHVGGLRPIAEIGLAVTLAVAFLIVSLMHMIDRRRTQKGIRALLDRIE